MHSRYVVQVSFQDGQAMGIWFAKHRDAEEYVVEAKEDPFANKVLLYELKCHFKDPGVVEVADEKRMLAMWVRTKHGWLCAFQ